MVVVVLLKCDGNVILMLTALRMLTVMVLMMQTMVVFDGAEGIDNSGGDTA